MNLESKLKAWLGQWYKKYIHIKLSSSMKAFVNVFYAKGNRVFFEIKTLDSSSKYFLEPFFVGVREFESIDDFYSFCKEEFLKLTKTDKKGGLK